MLFCPECGGRILDGEQVCKGCGKLSSKILDEILAMSEKSAPFKSEKCGGDVYPEQN